MTPVVRLVAGLLLVVVDRDRALIDQGIRQHQPTGAVPVAALPEEGEAPQQDQEDPDRRPPAPRIGRDHACAPRLQRRRSPSNPATAAPEASSAEPAWSERK